MEQHYLITVVNCFQFDYFCGYHTADTLKHPKYALLWIAFNLITFVDITQPANALAMKIICCELLSIWLLLWISHSGRSPGPPRCRVVNCFQFDYFCGYHTARQEINLQSGVLWIAFNLITFVDITQQHLHESCRVFSCELLSIWLLLWISHSMSEKRGACPWVVNCFQFDYFCGYHTAQ